MNLGSIPASRCRQLLFTLLQTAGMLCVRWFWMDNIKKATGEMTYEVLPQYF